MKTYYCILLLAAFAFLGTGCKDDPGIDSPDDQNNSVELLNSTDVSYLDNLPHSVYKMNEILLPNGRSVSDFLDEKDPDFILTIGSANKISYSLDGLSPQDKKNLLIARMQAVAIYLTDRSKHQFIHGSESQPAQDGLAYSFGSKDYKTRQKAPSGSCSDAELYGLDCSGFIYQVVSSAGLQFSAKTADLQRKVTSWESAFDTDDEFKDLKMLDLGQLNASGLECGDIIYWKENGIAKHIGIVLRTADGLAVFQSNGAGSGTCEDNYSIKRGPNQLNLSNLDWFDSQYGIVRLAAETPAEWDVYFRCVEYYQEVFLLHISVPVLTGGSFSASGSVVTEDDKINSTLTGNYDPTMNTLKATLRITYPDFSDENREDKFEVSLENDPTGYVPTIKVINNGGCDIEIQLIHEQESAALTDTITEFLLDEVLSQYPTCPLNLLKAPVLSTGGECGTEFSHGISTDCNIALGSPYIYISLINGTGIFNLMTGSYNENCSSSAMYVRPSIFNGLQEYGVNKSFSPSDYFNLTITEIGTNYIKGIFEGHLSYRQQFDGSILHATVEDGYFKARLIH
jgi:hypothetical protein